MHTAANLAWYPAQQLRLETLGVCRSADIHCHCLPGFDDGPATPEEAIALCRALAADGITTVVATPHQLGPYDRTNTAPRIVAAVQALGQLLVEYQIPIEVLPGGDVRIDERLPELLDCGEVTSLAGAGRHLLLELPHEIYVEPTPAFEMLHERGLQGILTHPERYRYLQGGCERPQAWFAAGAILQITAASLTGDFGRRAGEFAWRLVEAGMVSLVATDAHDINRRPPRLGVALELLVDRIGLSAARTIAIDNPLRVLAGEFIEPPGNTLRISD